MRKFEALVEGILQHTEHRNTFGSETKIMRSQQTKLEQMVYFVSLLTLPMVFTINGKPDCIRTAGMSPWNALGGQGKGK